ncbi:MAG: C25 family peptidase propeptide domain-containing protein, partial [Planctomycetota bacterium]
MQIKSLFTVQDLCWFFTVLLLCLVHGSLFAEEIECAFPIPAPEVRSVDLVVAADSAAETFDRIVIRGLPSNGEPGSPVLPILPVRFLLPQGEGVDRIEVISEEYERLEGSFRLPPSQQAYPLSLSALRKPTAPDPLVYQSHDAFPARVRSDYTVQYGRGYGFVLFNLFPVRYVPAERTVYFTSRMTVRIHTKPEAAPQGVMRCRGILSDRDWAGRMACNAEAVERYKAVTAPATGLSRQRPGNNRGGSQQGSKIHGFEKPDIWPESGTHLPYVIITNEALAADLGPYNFQALLEHRRNRGMPGMIKTVEE